MVFLLISFIITGLNFYLIGYFLISLLDKNKNYTPFDAFFIGLASVGSFLNLWSLFLPNNIYSFLVIQFLSVFILIKYKQIVFGLFNFKKNRRFLTVVFILFLLISLVSLVPPKLFDSYLYHINSIQWNEKFRVVPGLANLHDRFGFNSSNFVLNATYSYSSIFKQSLFIITSLSTFIFFVWLFNNMKNRFNSLRLISLIIFYFMFTQYTLDISSPGSDLLPNILTIYLIFTFITRNKNIPYLIYFILPAFCLTLKLSMLPIGLLSLYILIINIKNKKIITQGVLLSFIIVTPWIIRNIILTGYILYPFESIDLFSFDWKVPSYKVLETKNWVYSWARLPFADSNFVLSKSFNEWIQIWWEIATIKQRRFYVLFGLSILLLLFRYLFKIKTPKEISIVSLICFLGVLLWIKAPDIRFSFSFILFGSLLPLFYLKKIFSKKFINFIVGITSIFILLKTFEISYDVFKQDYTLENFSSYLIAPKNVAQVKEDCLSEFYSKKYRTTNGIDIEIYGPHEKNFVRCFDKFPCSPYLNEDLKLRGKYLKDGFKNNKK